MKGIQVRWPRRPWIRASPSNPATRKYSIEMVMDMHTEVRCTLGSSWEEVDITWRCTASLQCGCPQPSQCCISGSLDLKGWPYSMACEVIWPVLLHYFLWGYLQSLVFETPVETDIELIARIVAAYDIIQNTSGIFVRVRQNLVRRCHVCIKVDGRQFEQLL